MTRRRCTLTGEVSDSGSPSLLPELDPFGVPVEAAPALSQIDQQTLGFLGGAEREALSDSGLVKMGARMYDAETGAFVTRDPVTGEPGEPARRVAYAYAFNGPGRFVDLDGRSVLDFLDRVDERINQQIESDRERILDAAKEATRYYQNVIDDPNASTAARFAAKVGRFLTQDVGCGIDPSVLLPSGRFGRGGRRSNDVGYHYTRSDIAGLIEKEGLRAGSYVTKNGALSPLQAQIDLALPPNRGLPGAVIRVDLAGLRRDGYSVDDFMKVGRKHNMPGGGSELQLQDRIPPQYLKVVRR